MPATRSTRSRSSSAPSSPSTTVKEEALDHEYGLESKSKLKQQQPVVADKEMSPIQILREFAESEGLQLVNTKAFAEYESPFKEEDMYELPLQREDGKQDDETLMATIELDSDDEEVLATEEEHEMEVAMDSGCVRHTTPPGSFPKKVKVVPPPPGTKDFVGAGGDSIKRHGKVELVMEPIEQDADGCIGQVMEVADVTRPLHSLSQVADTDKELLFTKHECVVVPAGALSRFLKGVKVFSRYKRQGGLYTAKFKVRGRGPKPKPTFRRQGAR